MHLNLKTLVVTLAFAGAGAIYGQANSLSIVKVTEALIDRSVRAAVKATDSSYGESYRLLEGLSRELHSVIDRGLVESATVDSLLTKQNIDDITNLTDLDLVLIPRMHAAAIADTNLLVAAGLIGQFADKFDGCLADVVFEICRLKQPDLAVEILAAIYDDQPFVEALQAIDSISPGDRERQESWSYDGGSRSGVPPPIPEVHPITIDSVQSATIRSLISRMDNWEAQAQARFQLLRLDLTQRRVGAEHQLFSELESLEGQFVHAWEQMQDTCIAGNGDGHDRLVTLAKHRLIWYYDLLASAYQVLGQKDNLAATIRKALLVIDSEPGKVVIPCPRRLWFDLAVETGVYDLIEDLAMRMCYDERCQSLLACQEADSGRFNESLERILTIPDGFDKSSALDYLAREVHERGNIAGVRELLLMSLASRLDRTAGEFRACQPAESESGSTAERLASYGFYSDALILAGQIKSSLTRALTLFHIAEEYRDRGDTLAYATLGDSALAILTIIPDSLLYYDGPAVLRQLLVERKRLAEAELVSVRQVDRVEDLALAYGRAGDFGGVMRVARLKGVWSQEAEFYASCIDRAVASGDDSLASEFLRVAIREVRFGQFDGKYVSASDPVAKMIDRASELNDSKSIESILKSNQSSGYALIGRLKLAEIAARAGNERDTRKMLAAAKESCRQFIKTEPSTWDDRPNSDIVALHSLNSRVAGLASSLCELRVLSMLRNISSIVSRILLQTDQVLRHNGSILPEDARWELHNLVAIYFGNGFAAPTP